ncbi:hypothetical protein FDM98_01980 [Microbacterium sp. TL13]|nr:hypothetical protein [Microbacterium sp. TL13]
MGTLVGAPAPPSALGALLVAATVVGVLDWAASAAVPPVSPTAATTAAAITAGRTHPRRCGAGAGSS